uniref:Retrovirus-related Pol polyprotein from transposon TNT 1-94-like beta-barrel domain-containing protein n=1 Tax=Phytophthora ramorum TaxID=164328 RepID=H3H2M1_PHYRM
MVKDKTTVYEIFQTLCSKSECAAIHGDPYYIQSYLMALKYEDGSDLIAFIIDLEESMKAAAEATNSVLTDAHKSLYLFHSLPTEWKPELAVWKGSTSPTWWSNQGWEWFVTLEPTAGKSITVGGNHHIPIAGTDDVKLTIKDTKGRYQVITLVNVLYAPDLKFNLLSVRQAVETDYKINFPNTKKFVLFYDRGTKFEAKTGNGTRLDQFVARPVSTDHAAHVAKSGSG